MRFMEALTKLVVGTSRFGDHLLRQKVRGVLVAALAFGCGAGLADVLKREPQTLPAVVVAAQPADPARAEVSIGDTPADEDEEEDAVFDTGSYANFAYGYSVAIPYGMIGLGAPPPAPQHGFGIDLDNPRSATWPDMDDFPKSYLSVDGSCNSAEWRRLGEAVTSELKFRREKGQQVRLQSRAATSLGGLRALRFVVRYEQDGEEMVNEQVVAFSARDPGDDVPRFVYTIDLSTPLSKYERDRPVLEAIRRSWCLQPVE